MRTLLNATLTLVFTGGVKLSTWAELGSLSREVQIYRRLASSLRRVNFVTYGGEADTAYADQLGEIRLLPSVWLPSQALNRLTLWENHRDALQRSDVIKTHQIPGSDIAIGLKHQCGCKLITRCGYLWSLNAERESDNLEAIRWVRAMERTVFFKRISAW